MGKLHDYECAALLTTFQPQQPTSISKRFAQLYLVDNYAIYTYREERLLQLTLCNFVSLHVRVYI